MRPAAVEAMLPWLTERFGNPSGGHRAARRARAALDDARDVVADVVGGEPGDVVFTAGGTEADNLAVLGVHDHVGGVLVCGAAEHHAVLDPVLARGGRTAPVTGQGGIDLDGLAAVLEAERAAGATVSLVSVMLVNNEVGAVSSVPEVAEVVHRLAPGALVHTDAVQAPMWCDLPTATAGADLVSISGHKFGGPKGVGALVLRGRASAALAPRVLGGGQERGRRGGTQNVGGIVALAEALRRTDAERQDEVVRLGRLRDGLVERLAAAVPGLVETGLVETGLANGPDGRPDRRGRVAGIAHVCVPGVSSESLLFLLDDEGLCASAGASCSSGALEPSHVLTAMGVDPVAAAGSIRLSLGWASTPADVDTAVAAIPPAVERLRALEPTGAASSGPTTPTTGE
jgi:cysteine desulfurase